MGTKTRRRVSSCARQYRVPAQPQHQAAQIGQHDLGADALQAVDAAEEADRRHARFRIAKGNNLDRELQSVGRNRMQDACVEEGAAFVDDAFQFELFG